MTHLAITIGPIYKTIQKARKTRDIWASSFIFSLMMKEILKQLEGHQKVETILTPATDGIHSQETYHGAGIYPDRCFVQLKSVFSDDEMLTFRNAVYNSLPGGIGINKDYFHIYAVQANFSKENIDSLAKEDNIIFKLTKVLEDMELQQKFIQTNSPDVVGQLDNNIQQLYDVGMAENDSVFIPGWDSQKPRLPSIVEISTSGLSKKPYYSKIVTEEIWRNIRRSKKRQEEADEKVLANLKAKLKSEDLAAFKARYKYYAIIQSDGDSVGKIFAEMGNNGEQISTFSKKLMDFSQDAANTIADFGAIPIYIGGDDLLFIAPLVNANSTSLFQLIDELGKAFQKRIETATLSFGVAISYYKHPMSKALETSYGQLFYGAKKLKTNQGAKNALGFLVRKHSGQHFGSILPKEGTAYAKFLAMLAKYSELETTFLSATMYTLQQQAFLLIDALEKKRTKHFFANNFNEASHSINRQFLDDVEALAIAVHADLKGVATDDTWEQYLPPKGAVNEQNVIINTLFSCLRLIQFLNANDHE